MNSRTFSILVITACSFARLGQADTLHLKNRNLDINGTVTYLGGNFVVKSRFSGKDGQMTIGREHVSTVHFNTVVDNPGQLEGWMSTLGHQGGAEGRDIVKFKDGSQTTETVVALTPDELITKNGNHPRPKVQIWTLED